jgi:ABC-type transport system substrate-binding protein
MKTKILVLIFMFWIITSLFLTSYSYAQSSDVQGPKINKLLIKIYADYNSAVRAFEAGEIDILGPILNATLIDRYSGFPWNENISINPVSEFTIYEIDINNNETLPAYPQLRSLTHYQAFRHALAHLVNKQLYSNQVLHGYGVVIDSPVVPWLTGWYNEQVDPHPYNVTQAMRLLDSSGFVDADGDGIRDYPPNNLKEGKNLDPLTFYTLTEDPVRLAVAQLLTAEMQAVGIPVNLTATTWPIIFQKVMTEKNYHLYTGKQDFYYSDITSNTTITVFANLYHSDMCWEHGPNYVHFNNTNFDMNVNILRYTPNMTTAIIAAKKAQQILANEVGVIPLFAITGYKANKNWWRQLVNEEGNGMDNWWTFVSAHLENMTGGTLRYGIVGDPQGVNPLLLSSYAQISFVNLIYDSLLRVKNLETVVPSIAKDWEIGTWLNPDIGKNSTKITFYLNDKVYFHDGVQLTSEDVKFTIEYLKNYSLSMNYPKVMDIHHIQTPDQYTVIIYENVTSMWVLYWIGSIPILPKHKWQNITNPFAHMPEPTVTGSGPFKFVEYSQGNYILLEANRNYSWHDIAILEVLTTADFSGQVSINVTVANQGIYAETFNVSVYYTRIGDPLIDTQNLTLPAGANATLTFKWLPPIRGRYEILANTSEIAGEIDTKDNTYKTVIRIRRGSLGSTTKADFSILDLIILLSGSISAVLVIPKLSKKRGSRFKVYVMSQFNNQKGTLWLEQMKYDLS